MTTQHLDFALDTTWYGYGLQTAGTKLYLSHVNDDATIFRLSTQLASRLRQRLMLTARRLATGTGQSQTINLYASNAISSTHAIEVRYTAQEQSRYTCWRLTSTAPLGGQRQHQHQRPRKRQPHIYANPNAHPNSYTNGDGGQHATPTPTRTSTPDNDTNAETVRQRGRQPNENANPTPTLSPTPTDTTTATVTPTRTAPQRLR